MSTPPESDPPEGFAFVSRAPFVNHVGPIFQAAGSEPGVLRLGVRVAALHANSLGLMHGGMIATIVDSAMARALHSGLQRRAVTLKMSLEYLDGVFVGDWLEAEGRLLSHDEEFALTDCALRVGGGLRARGSGVFRLLRRT